MANQKQMNQMMKQMQQMQAEMAAAQEALAAETVEGTAGGGVVKAVVTGTGHLTDRALDDPAPVEVTRGSEVGLALLLVEIRFGSVGKSATKELVEDDAALVDVPSTVVLPALKRLWRTVDDRVA